MLFRIAASPGFADCPIVGSITGNAAVSDVEFIHYLFLREPIFRLDIAVADTVIAGQMQQARIVVRAAKRVMRNERTSTTRSVKIAVIDRI